MRAFEPAGVTANVVAGTGGSDRIALSVLPNTIKRRVRVLNSGTVYTFVKFGKSTVTAAAATAHPIGPGTFQDLLVPANSTHMAVVAASSTATVYATEGY